MSNPEAASSAADASPPTASPAPVALSRAFGMFRFWLRSVILPALAPLLVLAGFGLEPAGARGTETAGLPGAMIFVWLLALIAALAALGWLLDFYARGAAPDRTATLHAAKLSFLYRSGRLLFLAVQILFLVLLLPAGGDGSQHWVLAVGAAVGLLFFLGAPEELHPGAVALLFVAAATLLWPLEIFPGGSSRVGPSVAGACMPAGLNLYGGCLLAERAPGVIALHVVLALLAHFRRYVPALLVLIGLGVAVHLLGASAAQRDSLITLSAVILFFPARPYSSAFAQFARGGFWLFGMVACLLAVPGVAPAVSGPDTAAYLYLAWLVGLIFSEASIAGLRGLGLHL